MQQNGLGRGLKRSKEESGKRKRGVGEAGGRRDDSLLMLSPRRRHSIELLACWEGAWEGGREGYDD